MSIEWDEIFTPKAHSIWHFLVEGGQCCYIPPYQRPYSWDDKNILRLYEDVLRGIRHLSSRPNTINFIGTIIALEENIPQTIESGLHSKLPGSVLTIIDGQQRLCTILLTNIVMHDNIRSTLKQLDEETGEHFEWIRRKCNKLLSKLRNTYLMEKGRSIDIHRFYPRIIRAYSDTWSYNQDEAKYKSPIAKIIWEYICSTESGNETAFVLEKHDDVQHKVIDKAFRIIQKKINGICNVIDDDLDFPPIQESYKAIKGTSLPDAVLNYIDDEMNDEHHQKFCFLLRTMIFALYLNDHNATAVITTYKEDDAIDIFEALNTTGEPLTAFETLRTKVIEREGLKEYKDSDSFHHIAAIESYINKFSKTADRQKATTDMLIHFALCETGYRLEKPLTHQRRYLHSEYDKLTEDEDINKNRSFTHSLTIVASYLNKLWHAKKGDSSKFSSLDIYDEEAIVGYEMLRELNHSITIAPLSRFYQEMLVSETEKNKKEKTNDFVEAIKATVAFSILWRGSRGGTENIDSHYREIMKSGISFENSNIPPLARNPESGFGVVSTTNYKTALQLLLKKKGDIGNKEDWIKQASNTDIYNYSKIITRFLIFCASDDTVVDQTGNELLIRGRKGINPMLTLNNWNDKAYLTVEHVAPQSRGANWNAENFDGIYADKRTIHTLGNLTLLPKNENEILANRSWKHKRLMYRLLSAETTEEFDNLLNQLQEVGLTLSKRADQVLVNAKYLPLCKSIALCEDDWSREIIEDRSKCLTSLIWDRLEEWLFT